MLNGASFDNHAEISTVESCALRFRAMWATTHKA